MKERCIAIMVSEEIKSHDALRVVCVAQRPSRKTTSTDRAREIAV
jgi:hypothetical protein